MATSKRAWQKGEQFWAELHGETRNGPRGHSEPDNTTAECPIAIEHKLQTKRALRREDVAQARENAAALGLPWILVLHEKDTERLVDDLIVMDATTYLGLLTGAIRSRGARHWVPPASTYRTADTLLGALCKKKSKDS